MSITTNIHWVTTGPLPVADNEGDQSMSLSQSLPSSSLLGRRFFLCTGQCVTFDQLDKYPHSHIIGELRYVLDEGRKVTALAVYEVSLPVGDPPIALPPVRVELIGDARRIKCTCCIHRERWEIGKAAFLALRKRYEKVVEI